MNKILTLLFATTVIFTASGQRQLSLEDAITLAREQSAAAKRAETRKENRYWQYRVFRSNYAPQLQLDGTLPGYTNAVRRVQQRNGSFIYTDQNQNFSSVELSLNQSIAATGARVFVSTSLERFDDYNCPDGDPDCFPRSFGGDPFSIGFLQPIFGFNALKWDKKIEPLRFEESKREYTEEMEGISQIAAALFFEYLTAQISLVIATQNVNSNDTIYSIAKGRYELGKIPENDLLQLELNLMNSRQSVAQAETDLEIASLRLRSYLGIEENLNLELIVPAAIPNFDVDEGLALEMALNNRSDAVAFQRRRLEADRDVAQSLGNTGFSAELFGRFGLSNQGILVGEIYQDAPQQVIANLGFSIPVLDWGRQKATKRTAEANQQLVQFTVQQDEINFNEEVLTQVRTFKMLRSQVDIAGKADEISQKRYDIAKNRYLIGKISITDLSLALTEKDRAKQDYLASLGNFWAAYYQLRGLTLYDFATNQELYVRTID